MVKCGIRIAYLREKHGHTQQELSAKLGISRAALSHYETGRREPDYEIVRGIAGLYRVSLDYLLGHSMQPAPVAAAHEPVIEISDEAIRIGGLLQLDGAPLSPAELKKLVEFLRTERASS